MDLLTLQDPPISTDRPRVLVVDDEYGPREAIAFTLGTEFEVETADRAAVALEKITATKYAVVILDIRMPEMDGIKALSRLRKIDPEVAVVMLTGYGTLATAQQAMLGGANQYLRKPPDIEELRDAVRKQVEGTVRRRQEAAASATTEAMLVRLKEEISEVEPNLWQGKASVELVHDLANPLTVMIGYAALMKDEAETLAKRGDGGPEAKRVLEYASIVERAAEYCHHLAENWRQASRKVGDFTNVDLRDLAEEVKTVIFFSSERIVIEAGDSVVVKGSKIELARVFQNFFRNALEAKSTQLRVSLQSTETACQVSISDNGSGMSAATSNGALGGGFSTKPEGTGLGLRICRHILGAHGAKFEVDSKVGQGTCIQMTFPVSASS